jgi:3'-phosphoadenosine 5'-phosphosulfate sulfotransferase (PAPS reductase)/FAD synthetase
MTYTVSENPNPKKFISWGKGLQSTALCVMSAKGLIDKVDAIVTAETGWEHPHTYEIERFYTKFFQNSGIPVYKVQAGDIHFANQREFNELPLWDGNKRYPLKRQCTSSYKIEPIRLKMRELCGLRLDNKGRTLSKTAYLYLGISYDESERIAISNRKWIENVYPLVDMKWTRKDCEDFLARESLPVPMKSSCVICPYKSPAFWKYTKENYPEDFLKAIEFDESIRVNRRMFDKGYTSMLYLYKKLVPLADAKFTDDDSLDVCDTGYCFV